MSCLELRSLTIEIGNKTVCRDLSLTINPNERWALLGKNGVGKTTLLHSLLALHQPSAGEILVNNKPLRNTKRQELAKYLGILFQEGMHAMPSTVLETVLIGRHPHAHSLLLDDPRDMEIAQAALRSLDLEAFAQRQIDTLSGGEKQRVALAMLLAQAPTVYLLDEPSNHLDLAFQVKLLSALEQQLHQQSASVLMATHDINLAARFCDRFILLLGDGNVVFGKQDEVLTETALSAAYDCEMRKLPAGNMHLYYPALPTEPGSGSGSQALS